MTADPLDVALIGCGIIGVNHARAIARTPGLRITALVDEVPAAIEQVGSVLANELGLDRPSAYPDIASLPDSIAVVVICTPSGSHVELAEQAVARGAHVVLEKPLDVALDRGHRLARIAEEAAAQGIRVAVISQHRFDPGAVAVAEAAHNGRLGRVTSAVASVPWWRSQEYYDSGAWRGTWALDGGGAVMNQGVHTVDLLLWFLGTPVELSAMTALLAHERVEVEDVAVATIRFASGALAVLHATTAAFPDQPVRLAVYGSQGTGIVENDQLAGLWLDGDPTDRRAEAVPEGHRLGEDPGPNPFVEGHARQYADIVDAIRSGRAPRVGVPEALQALAVVRGIYVSATTGAPVRIADLLDGTLSDDDVRTGGAA
ncbi:Gfo/Idh/MocA family oxidoreductase [Microbacterium resistens]|uniref:Gfo/Idh/MocA family oxidoreductase n=1 Tax=Microbacterium resistens TaxID=156977 RepID=A0ABY3RR93_9MICO|nr:Gfo/Idh/MocA family oxidoreductase [Microbacterium resistens]UGS25463.1 Gfo/Idh/MocA family oxidoreductase [Microbacterium resistens]